MENQELLQKLRKAFLLETEERLRSMSNGLIELEKSQDSQQKASILEVLFRDAHSLKGAARSVSLHAIEYFFQSVEEVFGFMKTQTIVIDANLADMFQKGFGIAADFTEDPKNIDKADKLDELRDQIDEYLEKIVSEKDANKTEKTADSLPPQKQPCSAEPVKVQDSKEPPAPDQPKPIPEPKSESKPNEVAASEKNVKVASSVRISCEKLDSLMFSIEEIIAVKSVFAEHIDSLDNLLEDTHSAAKLCNGFSEKFQQFLIENNFAGNNKNDSDAANEKVPLLCDCFNEVRQRIAYLEYQVNSLKATAYTNRYDIDRLINENIENVREIVLQPFSSMTNVYPRMMRDVARETGKDFEFIIKGSDIEIDRRILEELNYPLIHLLRNAADHGIETPYARRQLGKPAIGTITLSASLSAGKKVEISVSDDGAGLDLDSIRRKIIEKTDIPESRVLNMPEDEVINYIFNSGFSTSKIITTISGRGLGMSIVRDTIENIGGTINVYNKPGKGTSFVMEIPISLSSFKGVIVESCGRHFAIPITFIKHVCMIDSDQIESVNGRPAWMFNKKTLPLGDLGKILEQNTNQNDSKMLCALIISTSNMEAIITVDRVVAQMDMTVKTLGSLLKRVRNISGIATVGTSKIVPVLNIRDIIKSIVEGRGNLEVSTRKQTSQSTILVAEDSITTRMLIVNILEAAGYKVSSAVDGQQAYEMLIDGQYDLLVSDIEMPRMSGFELTKKIRANNNIEQLPVVLCTTLSKREDIQRGIDAGASAYITKGNFEQSNLLETIKRLI